MATDVLTVLICAYLKSFSFADTMFWHFYLVYDEHCILLCLVLLIDLSQLCNNV